MARIFDGDELVIATHNAGKAREIADLLKPFSTIKRFYTASELNLAEPEETGKTFMANAELKALAAAMASGKPALADDSGLSVMALGGDPGIYSARWAVNEDGVRDFEYAMEKVRLALESLGEDSHDSENKRAAFVCALSLAWPDGHVESFEGNVSGRLRFPPRGDKGFGYDPIFVPNGFSHSFAEMDPVEKHRLSHRADAFVKLTRACFGAV